jgi:ABC-2 type transport system ATP-binding protein
MDPAIQTCQLTKLFEPSRGWRPNHEASPTVAVKGVDLEVRTGETYGLLGPNGAGKTTLVKMLATLILPSSGSATVAGHPLDEPRAIRANVGLVVSDERSFYWRLSARRNLDFFAALHGLHGRIATDRINDVLSQVTLKEHAETRFSALSAGMRQRLAVARSLLHRPQILFLDEPSRSLDPAATRRLHRLLRQLVSQEGLTIFLITHDLAEAEKLCERVALMHRGRIRASGPPDELRRQLHPHRDYIIQLDRPEHADLIRLRAQIPFLELDESGHRQLLRFRATAGDGRLNTLLVVLRESRLDVKAIEGAPPTLDEVFAHFTEPSSEKPGVE